MMKLKPLALGIAGGIFWGGCVFLTTLLSYYTGYARAFLEALPGSFYPGYSITIGGSFIGLAYGLVDGFITGLIFGWLYNKAAKV
jgi:hypothetical protein